MNEHEIAERLVKAETNIETMARRCEQCWNGFLPALEARLRSVEIKLAMFCGGLALLQVVVGVVLAQVLKK